MKDRFTVASYWLLFIILPMLIIGLFTINLGWPKYVLFLGGILVSVSDEHGLRMWGAMLSKDKS